MSPFQDRLSKLYLKTGVPLDRLPYSDPMDRLVASIHNDDAKPATHRESWAALVDLRKRGLLPKVGRGQKQQ
jgi:hypothetical protein